MAAADDAPAGASDVFSREKSQAVLETLSDLKLEPTSFVIPDSKVRISYLRPADLHESLILGQDVLTVSYSDDLGLTLISLNKTVIDKERYEELLTGDHFLQAVDSAFHDRETMLYGEYEITEQGGHDYTLKGFLKKQEDQYLPDQHNLLYQRSLLKDGSSYRFTCQAQGTQAQIGQTKMIFGLIAPKCEAILQSLKIEDTP